MHFIVRTYEKIDDTNFHLFKVSIVLFCEVIRYSTMKKDKNKNFDQIHTNNSNRFE